MLTDTRRETPEGSGPAAIIRRHPITAFLVWFFTVGQALAFAPVAFPNLSTEPFIIASTFVGLLLPALVITRVVDGATGLQALWKRAVGTRVAARWYAFAVVGVPVATVGVAVALTGMPRPGEGSGLDPTLVGGLALHLLVLLVTVNLWEEVAWMGFVQARLQQRHGAMRAAAVTGVLFALGHVSLVLEDGLATMALLIGVSIPFRALLAWVYNRTGSLLIVGLVHAAGNAVSVGSILGDGFLPQLYGDDSASGLVIPILALLGLFVIVATRARLGAPPPSSESASGSEIQASLPDPPGAGGRVGDER